MSVLSYLSGLVGQAFSEIGLPAQLGAVVPSQRPDLAQFQCNGAMTAQRSGRSPREIANEVVGRLDGHPDLGATGVAGPGFINLDLSDEALARFANETAADTRLGMETVDRPQTVIVDYAGPNVAKAMHVGHLRATIIGDSLARLFAFAGHRVIRDPHFGDWGFQMGLIIAALDDRGITADEIGLDDLQTIYPQAADLARTDDDFAGRARTATVELQSGDQGHLAVWRRLKQVSEASQRADFEALGVVFDLWHGESDVRDRIGPMVERMRASGVAEMSDGALVVRVAEDDDNREIPPLILESSAGGFLYSTTDLATIEMRHEELGADLCLYVVDRRQADHFVQLFRAARKARIAPAEMRLEHIGFGTMNGRDGKPFKTREGGVVRLGDVIAMVTRAARVRIDEANMASEYPESERELIAHQVGVAALKFGDLINNRSSDYIFDLDRFSSFEGKTGPYVQYAAVRINSILRRAAGAGLVTGPLRSPRADSERLLMLELLHTPEVIERAIELRAPNHVAEFAHGLAGRFNRFYDECHILSERDPGQRSSWLGLSRLTSETITRLLDLLGIEVPDKM